MPGIFITGTDTEIGKTQVACALLESLDKQGIKAVGMKPVASGAKHLNGNWQNEDATRLMEASSVKLPYELINPYLFKTPVSPHIAAELEQQQVELDKIITAYQSIEQQTDFVVVEGVGGWLVPLNKQQTVEDLVKALQLPVVMVVGMRLGCLNHALLTSQHIQQSGVELTGWIANSVDKKFSYLEDNINTLIECINAPLIARLDINQTNFASEYEKSISLLAKAK